VPLLIQLGYVRRRTWAARPPAPPHERVTVLRGALAARKMHAFRVAHGVTLVAATSTFTPTAVTLKRQSAVRGTTRLRLLGTA
jgi:hypothetical protein